MPLVETIRARVYKKMSSGADFIQSLLGVYNAEQDSQVMSKVAVLRIITQLLRLRRDLSETSQANSLLQSLKIPGEIMANS